MWMSFFRKSAGSMPSEAARLFARVSAAWSQSSTATLQSDREGQSRRLLVVGHLLIPLFPRIERTWHPEIWGVHCAIWLPLVVAMAVAALPFANGAVIGYCWATGITRHGAFH